MIAEYTVEHPTLRQALSEVPSARVVWEQTDVTDNGEQLLLVWVESVEGEAADTFEAFEAALHADPTVTAPRCLTEFSDRRLYQLEQVGEGRAQSLYPAMVEAGGIIQQCTATHEGWTVQALFPDTDALSHVHDACTAHEITFTLRRKFEEAGDADANVQGYGLTEKQREMLLHAVERGYYEVPRSTDLEALAEEMGISHQAASERLRRAVDLLVRRTISMDDAPAREEAPRRTVE